ncbi:MAG: hypothetical protein AAGF89_13435 [Bacteroidota bacterium]
MKKLIVLCLPLLCLGCSRDEPTIFGSQISIIQAAFYGFDVDIEIVPGQETFPEFTTNDSTLIIQISRTVDPDFAVSGDESAETILIVLPDSLETLDLSDDDWTDIKTFAYTSNTSVNEPVGRIIGGEVIGQRFSIDNSWELVGQVEISENFGSTFPLDLTGQYQPR